MRINKIKKKKVILGGQNSDAILYMLHFHFATILAGMNCGQFNFTAVIFKHQTKRTHTKEL